jgi:hypothetical protein
MAESASQIESELVRLRAVRAEVERARLSIQRELEMVKRLRSEAEMYRQQIAAQSGS